MAGRQRKSRKVKKAQRLLAGLVIEGLGFGICLWLLVSVWTANGGSFHFLLGGPKKPAGTPPSPMTQVPDPDLGKTLSAIKFPVADSHPVSISGWDRIRIRP